jgi:tRNA(Arg) A34 adenosine deaminase TadA
MSSDSNQGEASMQAYVPSTSTSNAMESSSNNDNGDPAAAAAGAHGVGPQDDEFVEIRLPKQDTRPRTVKAHVLHIEPRQCSQLVKQLAHDFPLGRKEGLNLDLDLDLNLNLNLDLTHLKRVQKPASANNDNKKQKMLLQVLVGAVSVIELERKKCQELTDKFGPMDVVTVPGRPPNSRVEWMEWNESWPTTLFPLRWEEHAQQQLALKPPEVQQMKHGMRQLQQHPKDGTCIHTCRTPRALVMDPSSGTIVATSWEELQQQQRGALGVLVLNNHNPLATPILLALQGVSRLERAAAMAKTTDEFSKGQYLCTEYDLYVSYEPSVFESMACVHARLRRLVFANANGISESDGQGPGQPQDQPQDQVPHSNVLHKGCSSYNLHCLPGTNHHYRAFRYDPPPSGGAKDEMKQEQDL